WDEVEPEHSRSPAAKVFLSALDESAPELMDKAVADDHFQVQNAGLKAASPLAMRVFVESSREYAPWRQRMGSLGLRATLEASAIEFATQLTQFSDDQLVAWLYQFDDYPVDLARGLDVSLGELLLRHGLRAAIARLVASEDAEALAAIRQVASKVDLGSVLVDHAGELLSSGSVETRQRGIVLLRYADVPEDFAQERLLPIVRAFAIEDPVLVASAAEILGEAGFLWATDAMAQAVQDPRIYSSIDSSFSMGQAFGALGDPRCIPALIGVIAVHDDYETNYGLGYFGLRKLTGVDYSESHDGAFWIQWWRDNRQRLGPEVASMAVPFVATSDR
ncbi:MAG: hypothetical protein AAGG01_21380, partial [Planctomycetota bacterium]